MSQLLELLERQASPVRRTLRAGEVLFHRGDPGDAAQVIRSGLVGLEIGAPGREPLLALIARAGDVVAAERVLRPGTCHSATGRALTDCEVQLLREPDLDLDPLGAEIRAEFAQHLAAQTAQLMDRLVEIAHQSATAKVAGALCRLAGDTRIICTSQDVVAAAAGIVRVTANAELRHLAERRVISLLRRRISILDRAALEAIAS